MVYCEGIEELLSVAGLCCEGRSVCLLYDLGQGPGGGWSRPERHLHGSRDWALHHDLSPRLPLLQTWPGEGPQSLRSSEGCDLSGPGTVSPGERQSGLDRESLVQGGGHSD